MNRKIVVLALVAMAPSANAIAADYIRDDSVICETEERLQILRDPTFNQLPGHLVFTRLDAKEKLNSLNAQFHQIMGDLAVKEERIRTNANMRGSTTAQQAEAAVGLNAAATGNAQITDFKQHCAPILRGLPVEVLERRPISGSAKLRMQINGVVGEVWTMGYYLGGPDGSISALPDPVPPPSIGKSVASPASARTAHQYRCTDEKGQPYITVTADPPAGCVVQ